ncbi:MAG: helix-turn-helix domain-containing protein [Chloroflexi bacterium]|nr:helix-turn-helix domain-containing protein [Chloroflexota bacterium]
MDDVKAGSIVRAVRIKARHPQDELARLAGVRPSDVSHLERGHLDDLSVGAIRKVTAALGMRMEVLPKWHGSDLDRLVNGAHGALQVALIRHFEQLPGWMAVPEVTFSIYGERGAVDLLAWHAATRTVLVVELKTILVDAAEIVRTTDQRRRLASDIAGSKGWRPQVVASWLIFTDTRTNRRAVERDRALLRDIATSDGRAIRSWLRVPSGQMSALSFWAESAAVIPRRLRRTPEELEAARRAEHGKPGRPPPG